MAENCPPAKRSKWEGYDERFASSDDDDHLKDRASVAPTNCDNHIEINDSQLEELPAMPQGHEGSGDQSQIIQLFSLANPSQRFEPSAELYSLLAEAKTLTAKERADLTARMPGPVHPILQVPKLDPALVKRLPNVEKSDRRLRVGQDILLEIVSPIAQSFDYCTALINRCEAEGSSYVAVTKELLEQIRRGTELALKLSISELKAISVFRRRAVIKHTPSLLGLELIDPENPEKLFGENIDPEKIFCESFQEQVIKQEVAVDPLSAFQPPLSVKPLRGSAMGSRFPGGRGSDTFRGKPRSRFRGNGRRAAGSNCAPYTKQGTEFHTTTVSGIDSIANDINSCSKRLVSTKKLSKHESEMHTVSSEVSSEMHALSSEVSSEMHALSSEVSSEMHAVSSEVNSEMHAVSSEVNSLLSYNVKETGDGVYKRSCEASSEGTQEFKPEEDHLDVKLVVRDSEDQATLLCT